MDSPAGTYPARLTIDYPERSDRLTTLVRWIWAIPILIILGLLTGGSQGTVSQGGQQAASTGGGVSGGISGGLWLATVLMIVFRRRYPRWWFDFARELTRFGSRVGTYLALLTDQYPSTVDEQSVHLEVEYPDVERDLNRWLPLVKWLLAIPHYVLLLFLDIAAGVVVIVAWFAVLFTGTYPRGMFGFVEGVFRWNTRVTAYAFTAYANPF